VRDLAGEVTEMYCGPLSARPETPCVASILISLTANRLLPAETKMPDDLGVEVVSYREDPDASVFHVLNHCPVRAPEAVRR
jgi:hypothetical protein